MPKVLIPDHLKCPINKSLFQDPVSTSDGQTYEREAIKKWIDQNQNDVKAPMTNLRLAHAGLCINLHILKEVKAFRATLIEPFKLETALVANDIKTLDSCSFIDDMITLDMVGKAVLHNSIASLQWLHKQDIAFAKDSSLVFLAVEYGAMEVTKWFFDQNPNCKTLMINKRYSLLDYAVDKEMFQFLLQKGVELKSTSVYKPDTIFLYCSSVPRLSRSLETFKLLYAEKKKMKDKLVAVADPSGKLVALVADPSGKLVADPSGKLVAEDDNKIDYWDLLNQQPAVFRYYWDSQTHDVQISMLMEENLLGDMMLHHAAWKSTKGMFEMILSIYKEASNGWILPVNVMELKSLQGDTVLHSICYRDDEDVLELLKFMKLYMGTDAFCDGLGIANKSNLIAGEILFKQSSDSPLFPEAIQFIIEHYPSDRYFKNHTNRCFLPVIMNMMQMLVEKRVTVDKKEKEEKDLKKGSKRRIVDEKLCENDKSISFKKLKT
jgi:hypothetical protein